MGIMGGVIEGRLKNDQSRGLVVLGHIKYLCNLIGRYNQHAQPWGYDTVLLYPCIFPLIGYSQANCGVFLFFSFSDT